MSEIYDYIIVGAGSAGCVLANRLTDSGGHSVLLLEAGGKDDNLLLHMPKGIGRIMGDERYNLFYPTEPEEGNGGAGETWIRGKTLGGSSAINGMVYNRGQPEEYNLLEEMGCEGWNWETVLPYFKAMEDHPLGPSPTRGTGGPLKLSLPGRLSPVATAVLTAAESLGLKRMDDLNGPQDGGAVGLMTQTIHKGRRSSAAAAFLRPAMNRPNLTVKLNKRIDRIDLDKGCARGVLCHDGQRYEARREVVLSAGALESPAILMRSGIGDGDKLRRCGIEARHHLPAVGRNLCEHRVLFGQYQVKSFAYSENNEYSGWRLAANTARYLITKTGLMAQGSMPVGAFVRVRPGSGRPDAQIFLSPYTIDTSRHPLQMEDRPCITLFGFILRPDSRGSLELRSPDPFDPPVIRTNYLATSHDREIAVNLARYIRQWVSQPPLNELIVKETMPGEEFQSDEELLEAWRTRAGCGYHTIGTCSMGARGTAVVDPRLRVNGIKGLRVMDASVLPFMVSGNTNAPVMAMAGRAADLILDDASAPASRSTQH